MVGGCATLASVQTGQTGQAGQMQAGQARHNQGQIVREGPMSDKPETLNQVGSVVGGSVTEATLASGQNGQIKKTGQIVQMSTGQIPATASDATPREGPVQVLPVPGFACT